MSAAATAVFTKEAAAIQEVGEDPALARIEDPVGGREGVEAGLSPFVDERFDPRGERPRRLFVKGLRAQNRGKLPASSLHLLTAIFSNLLHFVEGREEFLLLSDRRPEARKGPPQAPTGVAAAAMPTVVTVPAVMAVATVPALPAAAPLPTATAAATAAENLDEADETDRTE